MDGQTSSGGGITQYITDLSSSPLWRFGFAVLALVLLIVILIMVSGGKERFVGSGVESRVFTSGATQRHATEFSSTNQGAYTTPRAVDIKEMGLLELGGGRERLSGGQEPPVFYSTGSLLDEYRNSEGPLSQERMQAGPGAAPLVDIEDALLTNKLY